MHIYQSLTASLNKIKKKSAASYQLKTSCLAEKTEHRGLSYISHSCRIEVPKTTCILDRCSFPEMRRLPGNALAKRPRYARTMHTILLRESRNGTHRPLPIPTMTIPAMGLPSAQLRVVARDKTCNTVPR